MSFLKKFIHSLSILYRLPSDSFMNSYPVLFQSNIMIILVKQIFCVQGYGHVAPRSPTGKKSATFHSVAVKVAYKTVTESTSIFHCVPDIMSHFYKDKFVKWCENIPLLNMHVSPSYCHITEISNSLTACPPLTATCYYLYLTFGFGTLFQVPSHSFTSSHPALFQSNVSFLSNKGQQCQQSLPPTPCSNLCCLCLNSFLRIPYQLQQVKVYDQVE
jgi:hypothetical protein